MWESRVPVALGSFLSTHLKNKEFKMTVWDLIHLYLTHLHFFATHHMASQFVIALIRHLLGI